MEKLQLIYEMLEKINNMKNLKSKVDLEIVYASQEIKKNMEVTIDMSKEKSSTVKLNKNKLDYALMTLDVLTRIEVMSKQNEQVLFLNIKDFNDLKENTCDIIKEATEKKKSSKLAKIQYIPEIFSNTSTSVELIKLKKEIKKIGLETDDINIRSFKAKVYFDSKVNAKRAHLELGGTDSQGKNLNVNMDISLN